MRSKERKYSGIQVPIFLARVYNITMAHGFVTGHLLIVDFSMTLTWDTTEFRKDNMKRLKKKLKSMLRINNLMKEFC